ncbi:hypothetical protein Lepto7376_3232 [[Leptolyngbya] sp. PCC 7376]|uniref:response regulator n=1 Tax=[Leptolyngbya] sp. PCC 7376 TaxID=111781 RepID=UPI00029F1858|nr:response regulator [[Leptolyngbya] sp. PCC 7376]AFY39460.1 hypothetical protein Lepto7376_3232 [[Leptolyngbya] sp. PCC 7376]
MNVFILHQSDLQVRVWKKILKSQGIAVYTLNFDQDLKQQLLSEEITNKRSPDALLIDKTLPNLDPAEFCDWLSSRSQSVPVILIDEQVHKSNPIARQSVKQAGVFDLVPQFASETIAIDAITASKCITSALNTPLIKENLSSCIVEIQQEFRASASSDFDDQGSAQGSSFLNSITKSSHTRRNTQSADIDNTETSDSPPKQKKTQKKSTRKYRGRDY